MYNDFGHKPIKSFCLLLKGTLPVFTTAMRGTLLMQFQQLFPIKGEIRHAKNCSKPVVVEWQWQPFRVNKIVMDDYTANVYRNVYTDSMNYLNIGSGIQIHVSKIVLHC